MGRRRVAVALLPDETTSAKVQTLRCALSDPRLDHLPPHLTLVPPVNLDDAGMVDLRRVLRAVATRSIPFDLSLGPVASFAPATPTLHLAVDGGVDELRLLRDALRVAPIDRPDTWPFSPHVTLRESYPEEQIGSAIQLLTGSIGTWSVDRLYLLEQFRDDAGVQWRPVVEEPFGGPDVVGRGGIELVLRTVHMVESEVVGMLGRPEPDGDAMPGLAVDGAVDESVDESSTPITPRLMWPGDTVCVVAELPGRMGEPIAAAVGTAGVDGALLEVLHVDPEQQGFGIGRQVCARWCLEAARRGAPLAMAGPATDAGALQSWGFSLVGRTLLRQLGDGQGL